MSTVIDLQERREARDRRRAQSGDPLGFLEGAVARLEALLAPGSRAPNPATVERDLVAITRAIEHRDVSDAIERLERLADRLEHPAAGTGR